MYINICNNKTLINLTYKNLSQLGFFLQYLGRRIKVTLSACLLIFQKNIIMDFSFVENLIPYPGLCLT